MYRFLCVVVLSAWFLGYGARAKVVYVNANNPGTQYDGASWSTAFLTVTNALATVVTGDEVWVARGTYKERLTPPIGVSLYGGFYGTEATRDRRDLRKNVTILDGSGADFAPVVSCRYPSIVVDGFTLRYGFYGVVVYDGSLTLANDTVFSNAQDGVVVHSGAATLTSDVIASNMRCAITVDGGVAFIANNSIGSNGYGLSVSGGTASLSNSIVAFNAEGGVARSGSGAMAGFTHNDVISNAGWDYYGYAPPVGEMNVSVDPKFVNVNNVDFHLQSGSACIGAGSDPAVPLGSKDRDGRPRILGQHVDIGAYEFAPQIALVDQHSTSSLHDGLSWSTAFLTIGDAVAGSLAGDEVWVAKGSYVETITPCGGVSLYGGFAGTETQRGQRDSSGNATIVDGGGATDKAVVTCQYPDILIDGLALRNGEFGVVISGCTAALSNNTIIGNLSYGVIVAPTSLAYGNATLTGNLIAGNSLAGVMAYGGDLTASNNTISGNVKGGVIAYGHTVLSHNVISANGQVGVEVAQQATVTDNVIINNELDGVRAETSSGTIVSRNLVAGNGEYGVLSAGSTIISDNTITGHASYGVASFGTGPDTLLCNVISGNSTGVFVYIGSANIVNNTIVGNGHEGVNIGYGAANLTNNVLAYNGFSIMIAMTAFGTVSGFSHNDVFGSTFGDFSGYKPPAAQGNLYVDPLFVDRANGDFHLQHTSLCINAGDDSAVTTGATDLDGRPRTLGSHVDLGACEYVALPGFTMQDVRVALSVAAGLSTAPSDAWRLNVETSAVPGTALDIRDAVRLVRKVAGHEANP